MYNINIIIIKDRIISENTRDKKKLSKGLVDIIIPAKVIQISSPINRVHRYKKAISNVDIDTVKKLRLAEVKKY